MMPNVTDRSDPIQEVLDALKDFVTGVETSVATTRNHYGDYMAVIMAPETVPERRAVAKCLVLVGANKEGVAAALRLST